MSAQWGEKGRPTCGHGCQLGWRAGQASQKHSVPTVKGLVLGHLRLSAQSYGCQASSLGCWGSSIRHEICSICQLERPRAEKGQPGVMLRAPTRAH